MCSYFMLILVSSKMFLSVFFFSSITLMQDRFLLHANSNSLFVDVNKDKAHRGANLNRRVFVRCLLVLSIIKFHSITRMTFPVSILFQQEQKTRFAGKTSKLAALKLLHAFLCFQKKKKILALHLIQ